MVRRQQVRRLRQHRIGQQRSRAQVAAAVVPDERELRDGLRERLRRRARRRQARDVDVAAARGADPGLRVRRKQVGAGDQADATRAGPRARRRGRRRLRRRAVRSPRRRPPARATRTVPRAACPRRSPRRRTRRYTGRAVALRGEAHRQAGHAPPAAPARRAAPRRRAMRRRCGRCGRRRWPPPTRGPTATDPARPPVDVAPESDRERLPLAVAPRVERRDGRDFRGARRGQVDAQRRRVRRPAPAPPSRPRRAGRYSVGGADVIAPCGAAAAAAATAATHDAAAVVNRRRIIDITRTQFRSSRAWLDARVARKVQSRDAGADAARQAASASRQTGSSKPNVARKRAVASTPYAGRRAGVGYSALPIGRTRGRATSPTIAVAKPCQRRRARRAQVIQARAFGQVRQARARPGRRSPARACATSWACPSGRRRCGARRARPRGGGSSAGNSCRAARTPSSCAARARARRSPRSRARPRACSAP